jgi:hypothetical protein
MSKTKKIMIKDMDILMQHSQDGFIWTTFSNPTPNVSPYATTDTTAAGDDKRIYRAFYP